MEPEELVQIMGELAMELFMTPKGEQKAYIFDALNLKDTLKMNIDYYNNNDHLDIKLFGVSMRISKVANFKFKTYE